MSKAKSIVIVQGKNTQGVKPQQWLGPNVTRAPQINLDEFDEFKYGFPSNGLSVVSYKWWEKSSKDSDNNVSVDLGEKPKELEVKIEENHDVDVDDGKGLETGNGESYVDLRGTGLLSHLRKRAAKEGKEALRLGVYRGFDVSKVGMKERKLLRRLFKSSLPGNLRTGAADS